MLTQGNRASRSRTMQGKMVKTIYSQANMVIGKGVCGRLEVVVVVMLGNVESQRGRGRGFDA